MYGSRWWGTQVNPECKLLLLGHAFDCGFGRVKIQTDAVNQRSQAAIAKLGATREGVLRRHTRRADGSFRDSVVFSVLRDEWPAVRDGLARAPAAGRLSRLRRPGQCERGRWPGTDQRGSQTVSTPVTTTTAASTPAPATRASSMKMKLTEPSAATAAHSHSSSDRAAVTVAELQHPVVQVLLVRVPGTLPAGGAAHDGQQDVDQRAAG